MIVAILITFALFLTGYAACCNAKMDTVKNDHWSTTIYAADKVKYNDEWYDPRLSWSLKYKNGWPRYIVLADKYLPEWAFWVVELKCSKKEDAWSPFSDFWHFEKTKMILALCLAAVVTFVAGLFLAPSVWGIAAAWGVMYYIGAGIVWNETFNYYYDRKLLQPQFKKKWLWLK